MAVKKLRPLYDRLLIRVNDKSKDVFVNGVLLPESAVEKPHEGEVIAVGNGRIVNGERIPVDAKVGDTVVYGKYSGNEIDFQGEKLLLLQESELMGVFEN